MCILCDRLKLTLLSEARRNSIREWPLILIQFHSRNIEPLTVLQLAVIYAASMIEKKLGDTLYVRACSAQTLEKIPDDTLA